MRILTLSALALAATVSLSGLARADEYLSARNTEDAAIAAQSSVDARAGLRGAAIPMGYAETAGARTRQIEAIFAQPPHKSADQRFLEQGDSGLGTH